MFQSMVEWGVQHQSEQVLILQDNRELEEFQESYQEDQVFIFWWENSRNCIEEQKTIGPYELGQKASFASYKSSTI